MLAGAVAKPVEAVIFDVDGVLVDSPHERAWREALDVLMVGEWRSLETASTWSAGALDHDLYQRVVAGKPRLDGACAVMSAFGIPDPDGSRCARYAAVKQDRLVELIDAGEFRPYDDAIRFVLALRHRGVRIAAASSSHNASLLMRRVSLPTGQGDTLADALDADVSGAAIPRGKPDPAIFLTA